MGVYGSPELHPNILEQQQRRTTGGSPKKSSNGHTRGLLIFVCVVAAIALIILATHSKETINGTVGNTDSLTVPNSEDISITKENIIEQATAASYKDLIRNPDNYTGEYVVLSVDLKQIYENKYYFCYSNSEDSGMHYYGDVYCVLDKRVDDTEKLLESDVLKVYGRFTGLQEFTNKTDSDDKAEMPVIEMLYVDIEG